MGPLLVLLVAMTAGAGAHQCYRGTCVQALEPDGPDNNAYCPLNGTCTNDDNCKGLKCASDYSDKTLETIDYLATADLFQRLLPFLTRIMQELERDGNYEDLVESILTELGRLFVYPDHNSTALPEPPLIDDLDDPVPDGSEPPLTVSPDDSVTELWVPPLPDGPVLPEIDANDTTVE